MGQTIFVQIAAFRDGELLPTILDALHQAASPEYIHFGILWQYEAGKDEIKLPIESLPQNVRLLTVAAHESKGVCWARNCVQALYQGEDYVLSIDSHMRFEKHWDHLLIEELKACHSNKPVLSIYPPPYTLAEGPQNNPPAAVMLLGDWYDGIPRFNSYTLPKAPQKPLRGLFIAAGFYFTTGDVIRAIPIDPYYAFNHEELVMSLKLWSFGFDVFSPTKAFVYHLYHADVEDDSETKAFNDMTEQVTQQSQLATQRFFHQFCALPVSEPSALAELENYPLGDKRSLQAFEDLAQMNLLQQEEAEVASNLSLIALLNPKYEY